MHVNMGYSEKSSMTRTLMQVWSANFIRENSAKLKKCLKLQDALTNGDRNVHRKLNAKLLKKLYRSCVVLLQSRNVPDLRNCQNGLEVEKVLDKLIMLACYKSVSMYVPLQKRNDLDEKLIPSKSLLGNTVRSVMMSPEAFIKFIKHVVSLISDGIHAEVHEELTDDEYVWVDREWLIENDVAVWQIDIFIPGVEDLNERFMEQVAEDFSLLFSQYQEGAYYSLFLCSYFNAKEHKFVLCFDECGLQELELDEMEEMLYMMKKCIDAVKRRNGKCTLK